MIVCAFFHQNCFQEGISHLSLSFHFAELTQMLFILFIDLDHGLVEEECGLSYLEKCMY